MYRVDQAGCSGARAAGQSTDGAQVISTRGGAGLGDAIYLQSVVRYWIERGHRVEVCCDWPDVFSQLGESVTVSPFRRERITNLAHYAMRRGVKGTTQFQDGCIQAGIAEPVDLRLDWNPVKQHLLRELAGCRPIIAVQMPRPPFARTDGFGKEFLPDCAVIQKVIDHVGARGFFVQIGMGKALYEFRGIDLDLSNKTSVFDVLDIGCEVDGFLGFCSFIVPLAESLGKPALLVWSHRGLRSPHEVVRQMTPQKILHRASSRFVIDDWPDNEITRAADALLEQAGSPAVV